MPKRQNKKTESDDMLDVIVRAINKDYGAGTLMFLSSSDAVNVETIDTGSILLNRALGTGGWPRGRIIEIYGLESSGKTTLALHAIAAANKAGHIAAFIDVEHALVKDYAIRIGVDPAKLLVSQPSSGTEALGVVEKLVRGGTCAVIVVDSVAALMPSSISERDIGEFGVGELARLMSQALNKLVSAVAESNTCLMFINQIRAGNFGGYGSHEVTPGGNALKFYSSIRVRLSKSGVITDGNRNVGIKVRAAVQKNKIAPPFNVCEFPLIFNYGISKPMEVMELGIRHNIIKANGPYYSLFDKKFHGKKALLEFLSLHDDVIDKILDSVGKIDL
jgi:recombination protein RecA